jgi:hypothetical protein
VVVEVPQGDPDVDAASLRAAIGAELGEESVAPDDPRASQAAGSLRVAIDHPTSSLSVTFSGRPAPLTRQIRLPFGRVATERAAVLLAGNLARDEGDELAAELRKPRSESKEGRAAAVDARALHDLGVTIQTLEQENHARATFSAAVTAVGFTTLLAGSLGSLAAAPQIGGAAPAMEMLGVSVALDFFGVSNLTRAESVDDAAMFYVDGRGERSADVVRRQVEEAWAASADRERHRRHTAGILTLVSGGIISAGSTTLLALAAGNHGLADGGWGRTIAYGGALAAGGASIGMGVALLTTSGHTESAWRRYQSESGSTIHPAANEARLTLHPIVAPTSGGVVGGLGGTF